MSEIDLLLWANGLRRPQLDPWLLWVSDHGLDLTLAAMAALALGARSRVSLRAMLDGWLVFFLAIFTAETILKPLLHRPRPTGVLGLRKLIDVLGPVPSLSSTGMPSGTATAAAAAATWVLLKHGRAWGAVAWAIALGLSLLRLVVGVHYPTDLLVGWAIGVGLALGLDRVTQWANHTEEHP